MTRLSLAVVMADAEPAAVERLLRDVERIGLGDQDEVVLALSRAKEVSEALQEQVRRRPRVRLIEVNGEPSLLQLWGRAMAEAQGAFVAVLDGRDRLSPDWFRAFSNAQNVEILCGPVEPPDDGSATSCAAYLSEYGQFQGPLELGSMEEYPGNNIVFARKLLPDPETLRRDGFWKTFHMDALMRKLGALPVQVDNQLSVRFERPYRLGKYLARRYLHGRCFGGRRTEQPDCPPRVVCLLFTPLLPALRTLRVVRRTARKPGAKAMLLRAGVPLVLGEVWWSAGEAAGYAFGAGDCCRRVT